MPRNPHSNHDLMGNPARETTLFNRRIAIIILLIVSLVGVLAFRLSELQITQHKIYKTLSEQNQFNLIPVNPNRGLIYDRNGLLIAENMPAFSLEIVPSQVKNLEDTITRLQKIIPIDEEDIRLFYKELKQRRRFESVPLKIKLSEEEISRFAVDKYLFPGVDVHARLIRHYPFTGLFAHVVGYVGRIDVEELKQVDASNYSATNYIGKLGVEKSYENTLHGEVGYEQVETDASGRLVRVIKRIPPIPGFNLTLTIDTPLQQVASHLMGPDAGAVIAIDPRSGQVLAMVSNPSFDPNLFVRGLNRQAFNSLQQTPGRPLYNRTIRGVYPFGSTIKPFLAIEGLDSGVINTHYRIHDPGYYVLPGTNQVYRSWKKGGHGWVSVQRAITVSNDTFFYNLAYLQGINRMDDILWRFGFGEKTGIDIPNELPGLVASPKWKLKTKGAQWFKGDTINAGIGQGYMLTTPLQLASAAATMGNLGKRFRPYLVMREQRNAQQPLNLNPFPLAAIVLKNDATWDTVVAGMQGVIMSVEGTAHRLSEGLTYPMAGKTGTAQVYSTRGLEIKDQSALPYELRDNSLFIAFAPVENPRIAIGIVIEHSKRASMIGRALLDYYFAHEKDSPEQKQTAALHPETWLINIPIPAPPPPHAGNSAPIFLRGGHEE